MINPHVHFRRPGHERDPLVNAAVWAGIMALVTPTIVVQEAIDGALRAGDRAYERLRRAV